MNFWDLLFPKHCVGCGKEGEYFCAKCILTIKTVGQICPVCEKPSPFGQTHSHCLNKFAPDGLFSFFEYDGTVKQAIHKLKYNFVFDLMGEFWAILESKVREKEEEFRVLSDFLIKEKPLVVPIPLYWYKEHYRGFNQASLFGQRLAKKYGLPFSDKVLVRHKNVVSQTQLGEKERKENVKGIFVINSVSLRATQRRGEAISILLVDDVWTTGATMKEATSVLKRAGAAKVWGLTVAR